MSDLPAWARLIFHRRVRYAAAWLLALGLAWARVENGHRCFRSLDRVDGNFGHTTIDFGGQWIMGRMLASGHGRELFSRPRQWEVAQQAYTPDREKPGTTRHDPENLVPHFMGDDDPRWGDTAGAIAALAAPADPFQRAAVAIRGEPEWAEPRLHELTHPTGDPGIGGPLYPPIHAFIMLPFALGDHPQAGYEAMQYIQIALCFAAGLGASRLSGGRFWWPVAAAMILIYPGSRGVIDLGQNSALSLAILIWGWAFLARGQPVSGGVLWGLLAYKPVWAISFFLLLILIRQWRAALAMVLVGITLAAATVPFVGLDSWRHWLTVGQEAARLYNLDTNWIPLSRDVLGMPRRALLDFSLPRDQRETIVTFTACWALWALIIEIALRVYCLRGKRVLPFVGPLPALLILTAWMCTYHFMYYDALLSAFGICVLLANPGPLFRPCLLRTAASRAGPGRRSVWVVNSFVLTLIALMILHENVTQPLRLEFTGVAEGMATKRTLDDGITELAPRLIAGTSDHYPIDTLLVMAVWAWCVMAALARPRDEESLAEA